MHSGKLFAPHTQTFVISSCQGAQNRYLASKQHIIMKLAARLALFVSAFTLFMAPAIAQKNFEGSITYSIEYIEVPEEVQGLESMLPQEMTMQFSGDYVRLHQEVMGGSQVVVSDNKNKTGFVLMDMMGQKIVIRVPKAAVEEEEANMEATTVEEGTETKTIVGHKCTKATITQPDGNKVEVFVTDELGSIKHNSYRQLDGFPLEYFSYQDGMKLRMTATKVTREKLDKSLFEIPSGYTEMSMEELNQMGQ